MRWLVAGLLLSGLIASGGCNKKPVAKSTAPQAVVLLKDGTSFAGAVTETTPSQITLTAPNGDARTYQTSQVDSVQYATPPATVAATAPSAAALPQVVAPHEAVAPPQAAAPTPAPMPPPAIIPAGRQLAVRNNDPIDSHTASPGQFYSAVITRPVTDAHGHVVIPRGSNARLLVRAVHAQGKAEGQSELALDLDSVTIEGRRYHVETANIVEKGRAGLGKNSRTAKFVGGGTVLGAILGAVAGGGRGAAIGAASGAAAGTAAQTVTRGKGVRVPAETVLTFRLESPIRIISEP